MIVSATRRADIPAHYAPWLANRLRAGFCAVPNPFNPRQVARISLAPRDVDGIVLWTRDPRPLLPHLPDIARRGYALAFQVTLVEYPPALHPNLPPLAERLDALRRLADLVGPERVSWRYDPVVLAAGTDPDFHRRSFTALARALAGSACRATVSLLEPYRKVRARLRRAGVDLLAPDPGALASLFRDMAQAARDAGMRPVACADEAGLGDLGFAPAACVDPELLGIAGIFPRDTAQRPACRCAQSRDIGMYDACPAGCVYCYATSDQAPARRARLGHDPDSPSLLGRFEAAPAQTPLFQETTP